jgi:OOP family OmpA-OmpF porin
LAVILVAGCMTKAPEPYKSKSFFVFFPADSAVLTPEANTVIDRAADEAREAKATGVGIVGYTSPTGSAATNRRLADERAAAVEAALLARKVPRDVVFRSAQGPTEVAGPTIEGRRVEIVVSREDRRR